MKIGPFVAFLRATLPLLTDYFTDTTEIVNINATGGIATATTSSPHGIVLGANPVYVTVTQAVVTVPIISINISNGVGVLRTSADHGMILNFDFKDRTLQTILRIRGDSNTALNNDFTVTEVPNRFYVKFTTTLADGNYPINGGAVLSYAFNALDGRQQVISTPTPTTFTYAIDSTITTETKESSTLHTAVRIGGTATIELAEQSYTNYESQGYVNNKYWLFLTHGSTVTSKDRNILNDATQVINISQDYRQKLIEDFDVNVFCPKSEDKSALEIRDNLEDIKVALIGTIYGLPQFPQYSVLDKNIYTFVNDFAILTNRESLVHGYKFETMYNISQCDSYKFGNLVPFRNIDFDIIYNNQGNTKNINLDVEPSFTA